MSLSDNTSFITVREFFCSLHLQFVPHTISDGATPAANDHGFQFSSQYLKYATVFGASPNLSRQPIKMVASNQNPKDANACELHVALFQS